MFGNKMKMFSTLRKKSQSLMFLTQQTIKGDINFRQFPKKCLDSF